MKFGNILLLIMGAVLAGFAWLVFDMTKPATKASAGAGRLTAVLSGSKPVLVEFYADWCSPCRIVGPEVEKLANDIRDKAAVIRLNVDENRQLSAKYGVSTVPCFIAFKRGKETKRQVGVITSQEMRSMVGL